MAITSGFFNSVSGDRKYNAEQINEFFGSLISSGVLPNPSTNLQVTAAGGMTVNVAAGKGFIDSHWVKNDSVYALTIPTADSVLNRIDAVVMKLDLNVAARVITIEVKQGTPATLPAAPTMERSATVKEYCLATVYVGKSATNLTQARITDTRANTSVCGWVTGLITQVDTSTLFEQWEQAYNENLSEMAAAKTERENELDAWEQKQKNDFDTWFDTLTSQLQVNTYVEKYVKIEEPTASKDVFPLDMTGYTYSDTDIFIININGFVLNEAWDYILNKNTTPYQIETKQDVEPGNVIGITVLKSKIGQP